MDDFDRYAATRDKVTPWLWSNGTALEQAEFYIGLVPDSRIAAINRAPADGPHMKAGTVLTIAIELGGRRFVLLNGGDAFTHSEAASLQILCEDQDEVDRLWSAIVDGGGSAGQCGWCKDRWGLSWQVVPRAMLDLIRDPDPARAGRAMTAMLTMTKLDIAALRAAAEGDGA